MTAHSKLGASSMSRWANCPGSYHLCDGVKTTTSVYAEEGTKFHELASRFILGDLPAEQFRQLDDESKQCLLLYLEAVTEGGKQQNFIEHQFDLSEVYPGCFGTADFVGWNAEKKLLRVIDYKHGKGVPVEVEKNSQLLYYALGAFKTLGFPAERIELVVVQPRCKHKLGPTRKWRITPLDLMEFEAELLAACKRTEDPNAELVLGRWCYFCPAKSFCPKQYDKRMEKASEMFSPVNGREPTMIVIDENFDIFS